RLPAVLATAILGTITLACLGGARIQLRRRGGPSAPALDWEPGPDAQLATAASVGAAAGCPAAAAPARSASAGPQR
ncbi:MAG TPA: hypothetical protein VE673_10075, partial [Pseudonocardiaceae bacterium]|nr:hypothetical protein [Pseudonocardiaceae bacterium]